LSYFTSITPLEQLHIRREDVFGSVFEMFTLLVLIVTVVPLSLYQSDTNACRHEENLQGGGKTVHGVFLNICPEACCRKSWGRRNNASPTHPNSISQLIRGYFR